MSEQRRGGSFTDPSAFVEGASAMLQRCQQRQQQQVQTRQCGEGTVQCGGLVLISVTVQCSTPSAVHTATVYAGIHTAKSELAPAVCMYVQAPLFNTLTHIHTYIVCMQGKKTRYTHVHTCFVYTGKTMKYIYVCTVH